MPIQQTSDTPRRPGLATDLTAEQAESWRGDAACLAGPSACADTINQLAAILAGSPHLSRLAVHYADDLPALMAGEWEAVLKASRGDWQAACQNTPSDAQLLRAIRRFRNRSHLAIALSELFAFIDIQHSWSLLTQIAEDAVAGVAQSLLKGQPVDGCGWVIIGLGKLGAGELNYSSDIDLIALYDAAADRSDPPSTDRQTRYFNDLTRRLSQLLSQQTGDGFGWRVDFRLRPDPAVTPLCLTTGAALSYYESIARTWERAAFIRARPIAGDLRVGTQFLAQISSFIWRRNLDYTVLDDLQIWLRHLPVAPGYLGFDVKLGAFGIRHIELLTHLLQLLGGGRHENFRQNHTFAALDALADEDWLDAEQVRSMKACYRQWRLIEHRLQYLRDTQTHALPRNEQDMDRFAAFTGCASAAELREWLKQLQDETQTACTHPLMDRLLAAHHETTGNQGHRLASSADRAANSQWLAEIGFSRPEDMTDIIDGWMSGRIPATRSERARHYLAQFLPAFLGRLGQASDPDAAFACFTDLIRNLPAGAQIFALFVHSPQLADLVSAVLVKAPALTRQLSQKPALFDLLLDTEFFAIFSDAPLHPPQLTDHAIATAGPEQALDQLCLWAGEERFRVDVHLLQGLCSVQAASTRLSEIADICIRRVAHMARLDMCRRYGQMPDNRFAVIALGRLGSQRMTSISDLDLMFIYDSMPDAVSDGRRGLSAGQYYSRLSQLIISWLSVQTAKGRLFDVDARLRPDGKSGALATHSERLATYFKDDAWPWEYCAFLKARPVYTDDDLFPSIQTILHKIKTNPPPLGRLAEDIGMMRQRLADDPSAAMSLKKRPGGFLDAEFLAVLMAVQNGHQDLLVTPIGSPQHSLEQLAQVTDPDTDFGGDIARICKGLDDLELIAQFTALCIGTSSAQVSLSDNPQTWLALAKRLGLMTADDIQPHSEEICAHIATVIEACLHASGA